MLKRTAIVVGIDAYQFNPLTSAVLDAVAMRDALQTHGLIDDAVLLTSPVRADSREASRKNILAALRRVHEGKAGTDRMFFVFAGHGISTFTDPAHSKMTTALATSDVIDPEEDGDGYIDFGALLDTMRTAGPMEQLYFIDACRDVSWTRHPAINTSLGFPAHRPGSSRGQAVLYAVSRLGQAIADPEKGGLLSQFIIEALRGEGLALVHDAHNDQFVVTAQSVCDHVRHRVQGRLRGLPLWEYKYQLPEIDLLAPAVTPIRTIEQVIPVPLVVHIAPDKAAATTTVKLGHGRFVLPDVAWPPLENHAPAFVHPMPYSVLVDCKIGHAEPRRRSIDSRLEREVEIVVADVPTPSTADTLSAPSDAKLTFLQSDPERASPHVATSALEDTTQVVLSETDWPHRTWEAVGNLSIEVPPGAYRIEFADGGKVFSQAKFVLGSEDRLLVRPRVARSEILHSLRSGKPEQDSFLLSDSLGHLQADVLGTLLPLLAMKPFDPQGAIASPLDYVHDWDFRNPPTSSNILVSIVLALDGIGWMRDPCDELGQIQGEMMSETEGFSGESFYIPQFRALTNMPMVGLATLTLPRRAHGYSSLRIRSASLGLIQFRALVVPGHVTVLSVCARAEGSLDIGQYVLPSREAAQKLPGPENLYEHDAMSLWVHSLRFIQKSLQRGTSPEMSPEHTIPFVQAILTGQRYDPLLSSAVLIAASQDQRFDDRIERSQSSVARIVREARVRLFEYDFWSPHSSVSPADEVDLVATCLSFDSWRRIRYLERTIPVLMPTVRFLARMALAEDIADSRALSVLRNAAEQELWLIHREPSTQQRDRRTRGEE